MKKPESDSLCLLSYLALKVECDWQPVIQLTCRSAVLNFSASMCPISYLSKNKKLPQAKQSNEKDSKLPSLFLKSRTAPISSLLTPRAATGESLVYIIPADQLEHKASNDESETEPQSSMVNSVQREKAQRWRCNITSVSQSGVQL